MVSPERKALMKYALRSAGKLTNLKGGENMTAKEKKAVQKVIARFMATPSAHQLTKGVSPEKSKETIIRVLKKSDFRKRPDLLEYAISLVA